MGRIGETQERHDSTSAPSSDSRNAESIRDAMNGTSPRQRWREFPPTPPVDAQPVDAQPVDAEPTDAEKPKGDGVSRRKSLFLAGSFGFAALVIVLLSSLFVDRTQSDPLPADVLPADVAGATQTTAATTAPTSASTVDSTTDTAAVSTVAPTIAPELVDLAVQVGELELTIYFNDEVVAGEPFSFAVRIFNPSAVEIPVDALEVAGTIGGVPVEQITFLFQHTTIPADDSAVGTVRVLAPEADRPLELMVSVGGIELGRATIG